ncbi:MAG TPA: glycosyltransferase family 2 protein [Gemmatimonadales bacterium]|jgi:glycosyltransferase involved in cell wall biosynthesis|nr:glycosyltransferase family 2 protein [Gemmatimonadales bacterium]
MPAPLTVVIPTLNEASQIAECVRGLAWAGEVIVVDAESQDGTAAVARAAGARVLDGVAPSIAAQRNAGIAAASHEWVFALDADERIGADLAAELTTVVGAPQHEAYRVKRRNLFHGHLLRRGHWGKDWVVRLFRRDRRFGGKTAHPGLEGVSDFGALAHELDHTPYRDLRHHLDKLITYSRMSAADLAAAGRRATWSDVMLRPAARFWREYLLHGSVFDGRLGVIHAGVSAVGVFFKYAFLWEHAGRGGGERRGA